MSHLVTATIVAPTNLRREQTLANRKESIPSGFRGKDNTIFSFTENGIDTVDLLIENTRIFNLDEPVDLKNWNTLKVYKMLYPELGKSVRLTDPQEETNKSRDFSNKVFKVETFLRENENDSTLLRKFYRRLIGLIDGGTDTAVFMALLDLCKTSPDKFLNRGNILVQNEEFEMLALMDIAIERGLMIRDHDKTIKTKAGKIYAADIEKAAFQLHSDGDTRVFLQRAIENRTETVNTAYEPIIEDSEYVKLAAQVGKKQEANVVAQTGFGFMNDSDEQIYENIGKFTQAELLKREGFGVGMKWSLTDNPDKKFTKKGLIDFFRMNPSIYDLLNKSAIIL